MNIFRNLIGRVWQDPNATEVVKISTGQLHLVRPGNVRSSRECIYNDAMATIRRVPSVEHNFQLVITRVYEEGDQELLEDEEETDEERVFLISEELEFRTSESDGEPTLLWRDLQGDVDEFYEFVASGTNAPTKAFFETCMYRAMYERKYKSSADNQGDEDLAEFVWQPPANSRKGKAVVKKSSVKVKDDAKSHQSPSSSSTSDPSLEVIIKEEAELFLWDRDEGYFVREAAVSARIVQRKGAIFSFFLTATSQEGQVLAHRVSSQMMQRWSPATWSLTWNNINESGSQTSWCLRFESQESFQDFQAEFTKRAWESLNQTSWDKVKADDRAYVINANVEDVEMAVETDEDEEDAVLDELGDEDEDEEDGGTQGGALPSGPKEGRNSQLTVGYKGDRSYVVRGDKIGVFRHKPDEVEYVASIANIADMKGKKFNPQNVMLHQQDSTMIVMNPGAPNSLFHLDIERAKIVEEWKIHDDVTVDHIAPNTKFSQTTHEQTLIGASHNALYRIDPRVSGKKLVDSQYKQYASKHKFSGVTTTASGKLAVASEKGDIRLYDTIGKIAKTALTPLGDPIIGIDVSADGRWIVATTNTYLLLVDALIGQGKYAGSLGFDRSFPADAKPMPKRLQLRPEHVAYMNHNISFTPARFNIGEGQEENAIVTSTGQYVIAWDFAKVKKGQMDKYEIKKYEDLVVQDNFRFGDDKEIIVALQNNVLSVNKKQLRKPTRTSLAPDRRSSRSHSGIVNAPY
ncbi:VID27 cytoplasmic protein-domain-containing protein [Russula earlei]|uniref:VID27 cytoplasmic protein-domain-containing protein n=1 Tax=Russula earlei TaxID=71964 RepID=A0ACC0UD07_9AGAM|nr:VID27 cytoplasmic protein-domain-containing protein [Russula earlei]